jgi:hypothetical protein
MIAKIDSKTGIEVDKISLVMIDEEKTHVIVDGVMIGIDNEAGARMLAAFNQMHYGRIYDYSDETNETYKREIDEIKEGE